ncbi:MAG: hypothetical protein Q7V05_16640 [Methanoregula sp.]|nr:hypothetical protein [Methanoregula sp.]
MPIQPSVHSQRQEHEDRADAERDVTFEDVDGRKPGVPAGQVPDQPEAQDAVARTDAGDQAEDEDAGDGGVEGHPF